MSSRIFDPEELYLFSLRTGRKLPEELHNHMLLWSFDERGSRVAKDYMEWIEHCRLRDETVERTRRRLRDIERIDRALNVFMLVVALALSMALVISGRMR